MVLTLLKLVNAYWKLDLLICVSLTSKTWTWHELNILMFLYLKRNSFLIIWKKVQSTNQTVKDFFWEIRASWIVNWSFKRFSTLMIQFKQMNDDKAPTVQHFHFRTFFQNRNFCILLYHREHLLQFAFLRWCLGLAKMILSSEVFHVNNE